MSQYLSLLFIALAGICNAAMDRMEPWTFYASAFHRWGWPDTFWNREKSSGISKTVFGWKFDGWHSAKSLMVIFFCLAIVIHHPFIPWLPAPWMNRLAEIIAYGAVWNVVNPNFYKRIFN